jgi:hypothetical protein
MNRSKAILGCQEIPLDWHRSSTDHADRQLTRFPSRVQCLSAARGAPLKTQRFYSALITLGFEPFQPFVDDVIRRAWESNLSISFWCCYRTLPPRVFQHLATRTIAASFGPETVAKQYITDEFVGTAQERAERAERAEERRIRGLGEQRDWERKKRFGRFVGVSWAASLIFWAVV